MKFSETPIAGAFVIDLEPHRDERGSFARAFCQQEFAAHGLNPAVAQCNLSHNAKRGTLRGLHYQAAPHGEAKLVRCIRGAIYDVIVDLRPDSPSFKTHVSAELSERNGRALYVPEGVAHGFLTLEDDSDIFYQMSTPYHPEAARGVRWDDPTFGVPWPESVRVISERDATYPDTVL